MNMHQNKLLRLTCFFILLLLMSYQTGYAADKNKAVFPRYPVRFEDGTSTISRIADKEIVLGDSLFKYSNNLKIYDSTGLVDIHSLDIGDSVGIHLESQNIIETIWLVKKNATPSKTDTVHKNKPLNKKLFYLDGKWRN